MSFFSPRPGYSTSIEAALLTALNNLAAGGTGTAIQKVDATTFANVTLSTGTSITLTTNGTSGAATLINGVLNIPNYTSGGGGSGTVTSVATDGTLTGGTITTTGTLGINLSNANIWAAAQTFASGTLKVAGPGAGVATISYANTGTSATLTIPSDNSGSFVIDNVTQTLTNKTFTTPVINGITTGTGISTSSTVSTIILRDTQGSAFAINFVNGFNSAATAGGTTTLTNVSNPVRVLTGTQTQTLVLPVTSTLTVGYQYQITNQSTGAVTIQSSDTSTITILAAGTFALFTCVLASGTTAASWNAQYFGSIITSGKSFSVSNTIILAGTDGTTMTFPSTSATIARTDAAQTFTGTQTFAQIVTTSNAITASGNAATVPITSRISTVTNNSAATLTITITTASAVDGQMIAVRILDFSAVAQTITWVNTENSTVGVPATSNGSTTLPLTVGFQFNSGTSKWRCIGTS